MRQPPKQPDPNWSFSRVRDAVSILEIPPGKSAEQIALLGDLLDVSKPGKYRAKVSFVDPLSNQLITSNTVSFEIEDPTSSSPLPKQPPFIVTLQSVHFSPSKPNVLICMSNISDHDIGMDNFALKDFVSVEAPDGTRAAMNEAALKDWEPEKLKQVPAGPQGCQFGALRHVKTCVDLGIVSSLIMPSDALWRRAAFKIQPPLLGAAGASPFSSVLAPSAAMVIYAALYAVLALIVAQILFDRRDL